MKDITLKNITKLWFSNIIATTIFCLMGLIMPIILASPARSLFCIGRKKWAVGKVVLITGASSGLGEALAHVFYKAGCKVILSARRETELERVRDTLLQTYKTSPTYPPVILPLDLSDVNEVFKQGAKAISIYGHVDILINNAGIGYRGKIISTDIEVDEEVMKINYLGPVALVKALLPHMIKRRNGNIVAICSVQGLLSIPYRSAYGASKHALLAFHDCLRSEVSHHNIKVTVINPGYIRTNLSLNALKGDGETYGIMDPKTANGKDPMKIAKYVFQDIIGGCEEEFMAGVFEYLALMTRHIFPHFYFWVLKKKVEREERKKEAKVSIFPPDVGSSQSEDVKVTSV